ncbi:MAG: hypothetical protein A3G27_10275 [Betaproteobacteria bacterium RIFCSPLOWO2_12_FULL_66_14]|nr:MAG: hypothetical protein A3G27_10275 [Betaproteobacteria bacterium RIFCSPLOWO2_12_FULL_66_14]
MNPACSLALKPSLRLAGAAGAVHLLALAAAWTGLSGMPLILTAAGVMLSGLCTVADALLLWPGSVARLELAENGSGRWLDRAGREHRVRAARATWVSAGVVVLGLQMSRWRTRWVVLLPDSAAAEPLRRLRAWLKWRPS